MGWKNSSLSCIKLVVEILLNIRDLSFTKGNLRKLLRIIRWWSPAPTLTDMLECFPLPKTTIKKAFSTLFLIIQTRPGFPLVAYSLLVLSLCVC